MPERTFPCEFCDTIQPQERKLVTITRRRNDRYFFFEDVPAGGCPNCGYRYFDADVVEAMEQRMTTTPADARPVEAGAISLSRKAS